MKIINKYKSVILFTIAGVVAGVGYWYFIGCNGGSCPITSNWYSSALYGGAFGFLLSDFRLKKRNQVE